MEKKEFINNHDIFKLLKEVINVLIKLKNQNLYHMDIKPCNILMSEKFITELDDALNV